MNTDIMHRTLVQSLDGTMSFPEVVQTLLAEGVESYHVDLVRLEKIFYMPDGSTHVERVEVLPAWIAEDFSTSGVEEAIRASQAGACTYPEFLTRVMAAGTASYTAFLTGGKCIYWGRKGEFHVEEFPQSNLSLSSAP